MKPDLRVIEIPYELHLSLLGMTNRQTNMAFYATCDVEAQLRMLHAFSDTQKLERQLAAALDVLLRKYLSASMESHPAAARRIMAGKPPRRRKRAT